MRGSSAGARGRALPRSSSRQRNLSSADEPKASSASALPLLSSSNPSSASTSASASPFLSPSSPANSNKGDGSGSDGHSSSSSSSRVRKRAILLLAAALWTVLGLWQLTSSVAAGRRGAAGAGRGGALPSPRGSGRRHGPPPPAPPPPLLSAPAALAARVDALASWAGPELLRPAMRVALSARELLLAGEGGAGAASFSSASSSSSSSSSPSSPSSTSFPWARGGGGGNGTAKAATGAGRRASSHSSSPRPDRRLEGDDGGAAARAAVAAALASPGGDEELSLALGLSRSSSSSSSPSSSESLKAFDAARAELSAVLSAAAAAAAAGGVGGGGGSFSPSSPPPLLACPLDPTLPLSAASAGGPVLVAADVSNAELVAPHLVVQAAHLLALLPRAGAFLSIYESGSSAGDATRDWLLLAKALASALGSPSRVVVAGRLQRRLGQDRIEFLAEARNRALQPLWSEEGVLGEVVDGDEGGRGGGGDREGVPRPAPSAANGSSSSSSSFGSSSRQQQQQQQQQQHQQSVASSRRAARVAAASDDDGGGGGATDGASSGGGGGGGGGWPAARVLFLNDVFFCASDALRLLAHVDPGAPPAAGRADLSCGLDFDRPRLQDAPLAAQADLWASRLARRWRPLPPFFLPLPRSVLSLAPRLWPGALLGEWKKEGGAADSEFQAEAELQFYDIWVARDALGRKFEKAAPHVSDPYSLPRVSRGLPFPVKCCWNGLVAMDAGPFVAAGEVGAGRREWRRREREERESKRGKRGGAELDGDDGIIPTSSSVPAPSFPPLRFRAAGKGECAASECSLLCNDLLRRGAEGLELEAAGAEREERGGDRDEPSPFPSASSLLLRRAAPARILVDPGVRVAYTLRDAAHLRAGDRVRGIAASSWADVSRAPAVDWGDTSRAPSPPPSPPASPTSPLPSPLSPSLPLGSPALADPAWEACCLKPGADAIVWSEDCGWDSWRRPSDAPAASSLGAAAARRRREAGFVVDERVTVVGAEEGGAGGAAASSSSDENVDLREGGKKRQTKKL